MALEGDVDKGRYADGTYIGSGFTIEHGNWSVSGLHGRLDGAKPMTKVTLGRRVTAGAASKVVLTAFTLATAPTQKQNLLSVVWTHHWMTSTGGVTLQLSTATQLQTRVDVHLA
ncbi:hypothetical protein O9993_10180 [Vibrio lentus]|nr:hypothetical protein [Vibrio lentus]